MNTDAKILRALRAAGEGTVSGAELSQKLGVSRAAIWAHIEELRELGYDIEASPHLGYRLRGVPDVLHADDLMARLEGNRIVGRDIKVFQETTSTSDVVDKLSRDGVPEGIVVFAEAQTKGRGRMGRSWVSPSGLGLWFSVLLRPRMRPQSAMQLTVAAATAVTRALRSRCSLPIGIKWPNDILVQGRKLVGILTEMSAELDSVRHLCLGVGMNINQEQRDFPRELHGLATSLRMETGEMWSRSDLAVAILKELDVEYDRIICGRFSEVVEEWARQSVTLGHPVTILVGNRKIHGRAESLDVDGALLVRTQHGHLERIVGGEVVLEKK
jgi:BirA family biotin operon repressor/biotin-[acetyl-CoA-carboxylase] ligase